MQTTKNANDTWKNIVIKEFSAPQTNLNATHVIHTPPTEIREGQAYVVEALVVSVDEPESVRVSILAGLRPKVYEMQKVSGYRFSVTIPAEETKEGFLQYFITIGEKKKLFTYPGRKEGSPSDWDFNNRNPFEVRILSKSSPVYIFDAHTDNDELSRAWNRASSFIPGAEPGKAEIRVIINKLFAIDAENPKAANINDYSMRYYFGKKVTHNKEALAGRKDIIFRGRSLANKPCLVQLALITKTGEAVGGVIKVDSISGDYKLSVKDLKKVRLVTLPRPYPTFLPYFFEDKREGSIDLTEVETLQISIGPGIPESELNDRRALAIESVRLE